MNGNLWLGFLGGLFSFAHCLGMCGGFALHLSQHTDGVKGMVNITVWQAGRLLTYVFLGALAGYSGMFLTNLLEHLWLQNILSFVAGTVMIVMGAVVGGFVPVKKGTGDDGFMASIAGNVTMTDSSPGGALMLGIATGCLPCPVVIGFLAYAAQTRSVAEGLSVMAGMGVGTFLPLLLLGSVGGILGKKMWRWGRIVGSAILIVLGAITILRGSKGFHHILGCTSSITGADSNKAPCCKGASDASGHHP